MKKLAIKIDNNSWTYSTIYDLDWRPATDTVGSTSGGTDYSLEQGQTVHKLQIATLWYKYIYIPLARL